MKEFTASTSTFTGSEYPNWVTGELIRFVRDVKTEEDALVNIPRILKRHEERLTAWQLIKLLLKR